MTKITIHLPPPISTNAIWRSNRGRVHRSKTYNSWYVAAGWEWRAQHHRQPQSISGHYRAILVLDRARYRKNADLDNYYKGISDWAAATGLVENDKLCNGILIRWGTAKEAPLGARLVLRKC